MKDGVISGAWLTGCRLVLLASLALPFGAAEGRSPTTHRLEATPSTVVYGYYWSEATPALRIASGDIIDVDTLLTNTPAGLAKAGVPDEKIQSSLKAIVEQLTGARAPEADQAPSLPEPPSESPSA